MDVFDFSANPIAGRLLAVCVSDRPGPKRDVGQAQLVKNHGVNGDLDSLAHFLTLLSEKDYLALKAQQPDLIYGALGENLVVSLELTHLRPGQRLRSGDALIELTERSEPLHRARVILNGIVTVGDQIVVE
jgi:MOSC domain-containing protein YiiM